MDSYIIRIYRRNIGQPDTVAGVLENPSDGAQRPFKSRDELWAMLTETVANETPPTGTDSAEE